MKRLSPLLIVAAVFALRALAQVVDITQLNTPTNVYSDGGGVWITGGSVNATVPVPIGVVILDGGNLGTTAYQGTSPWVTSGTSTATIVQPIAVVILDGGNLGVTAYQGTSPWSDNIADVGGSAAVTAKTGVLQVGVIGGDGGYVGVYEAVQPIGVTIVDGGNIFATLVGTSPVSVGATISQPLGVTIVDGGNLFAAVQGTAGGLPISVQGSADGGLPLNVAGAVTVSGTVTATVAGGTVQGTAAGAPISVQGSADGGLALNVDISSGPLSDGGVACSNAVAANLNADVILASGPGSDGGWAVSNATAANLNATCQGAAGGVPISIQGAADGGFPVYATDLADNKIDAGVGTWAQVTSGLTGTNGTTPTAAPAGVTLPNLVNQDGVQYVHIGPPNAIHYYESTSSEALVIVAPATGTSYYLTDWTLSCGTTAQEVKLLDCDAGTIVTYEDVYCAASGGATHSQISPVRIVAGKSVCCDPVGGTTATCTTDGYVAP